MTTCPDCDDTFSRIGAHWQHYSEHRPSLSERQHEIVTGLLMGDGGVYEKGGGSYVLMVSSVTKPFLEHLSGEFGVLGGSLYLNESAEEMAERQSGRTDNFIATTADDENYQDVWMFSTRSIPELGEYRNWYDTGCKVWPDDIKMTPTVLKYWYAGDGCYEVQNERIRIAMDNERDYTNKVEQYFEQAGLPVPNWNSTDSSHAAYWSKSESKELLEHMERPIPGFEYKWP